MILSYEIHNQQAIENAHVLLNGPYRDPHTKLLWPKGKPLILSSVAPSYCKIITDSRKWSV
jgi:hypothetical protein